MIRLIFATNPAQPFFENATFIWITDFRADNCSHFRTKPFPRIYLDKEEHLMLQKKKKQTVKK